MELQKGICVLCHNNKVIKTSRAENAFQIISSLFSKEILNISELNNIRSSLRFCPICYHKLIILKCTSENIETNNKEDEDEDSKKCVLCKSGKFLFEIINWPFFNKISEDLVSQDKNAYIACSDCLFYLDTRNVVKSKLISKYPRLKVKPANNNEKRRKSRNTSDVLTPTTVVSGNKRRRSARDSSQDIIDISSDSDDGSPKQESFNYGSLKKLKPLKHNRIFKQREIVKSDSKFLNQIPCVLLKSFNFNERNNKNALNNTNDEGVSANMAHEEERDVNTLKPVGPKFKRILSNKIKQKRIYPKSIKLKREISKRDIAKKLVVNLTKMNILQKHKAKSRSYKHDPEIENLIDKFNILQRPTTPNTSKADDESSSDDLSKEKKAKAKRKSVSFAEEKNVEIEYYQNDSKPISSYDHPKELTEKDDEKHVSSDDDDAADSKVTSKSGETEDDEKLATFINGNEDSHTHAKTKWKIKWKSSGNKETAHEDEENEEEREVEVKKQPKKEKPKPLSKRKGRNSRVNLENTTEDGANEPSESTSSKNDKETSSFDSLLKKNEAGSSEALDFEQTAQKQAEREVDKIEVKKPPKREKPKPLSKKKREKSTTYLGHNTDDSDNLSSENDGETISPQSLSKKNKSFDSESEEPSDVEETTQEPEKSEVEIEVDKIKVAKRDKPKPLSKKKRRKSPINLENTTEDGDNTSPEDDKETASPKSLSKNDKSGFSESEDSSDIEETTPDKSEAEKELEVKNQPKREKPKPLSKKKREDSLINLEDNTEGSGDRPSENTSSENDKETGAAESFSKEDKSGDSDTPEEVTSKDNDDNASSNEQEELDRKTDADVDNEANLAANNEVCADDEGTEKDETNKSKESSPSRIDNGDSTNGNVNLDVEEETDDHLKEGLQNEDNERECTSDRKEYEEGDSANEDESDKFKKTSEESTQLKDPKDIDDEENINRSNSESGNDLNLNDENKKSDEYPTEEGKTDDDSKKIENFDSNSFSSSDKNDEVGISEDDTNNINSILTGMLSEEQSGDEWKVVETDSDDKTNHKRKMSDDELNTSTDKKKKKVTFCEDFT